MIDGASLDPGHKGVIDAETKRTRKRRTYIGEVVAETVARTGAKVGLAWIGVVAFCALFAPLLANSHPLLYKSGGEVSSPMLKYLTATDVILLIQGFGLVGSLMFWRASLWRRVLGVIWLGAATAPFVLWKTIVNLGESDYAGLYVTLLVLACLLSIGVAVWIATASRTKVNGYTILLAILALGLSVFFLARPIDPPLNVSGGLQVYRVMEQKGEIEWAVLAPVPFSSNDRQNELKDTANLPPGPRHPLGTDGHGADMLSGMIYSCRISLAVGFVATSIAMTIGLLIGGFMGYFVGKIDLLGMRIVEIVEAIPQLYLLLIGIAALGRNLYLMMALIGFFSWPSYARYIRAEFLKLRKQDFVQSAKACGLPLRSVLFRHMLPNGVAPVLVAASFGTASAILLEAFISFLGLGPVDTTSWGQLLNFAVSGSGGFHWWIAIYPGMAIFLTVFSYNLIGEALRDAIDPHLKKAAQL